MAEPTWEEVKAVLDDPNVSEDKKQSLMEAYGYRHFNLNDEQEKYADRYDVTETWKYGALPNFSSEQLEERMADAKAESETKSYNTREQTKAVDAGQKSLDAKQPPTASGAGTKHSDELFDAGKAGLKVFEKFMPIWNNRPGDCLGNTTNLDYANHIQLPYDEQRGMNFHKLLMEADEFSAAKSKVDEMRTDVDAHLKALYGEWEGKAATKSHEHYSDQIVPKITELSDGLHGAAELTRTAVSGVYQLCKSKADEVLGMYREQIAQADTYMAEKVVSFARGQGDYGKDRVREIAGWVDSKMGSNIAERLNDDDCELNDENRDYAINQCKRWIQQSFNVEFWGLYEQFKSLCETTKTSVDAKWQTLSSYMAGFENPFPAASGGDNRGGDDKPGGGGDKPGGGGGTPGGGTPGGGGGTPGGGGGMPQVDVPKPENPLDKDGDGKPDDLKVPGDLDGDGKVDDLDGDGKPDGLKGEEEPETVTIKSGDNEIKITEPDERGHVQITVDTPTSEPKTYDVDFSNNPDALKALTGQNGGAALAGALAGATGGAVPGGTPAAGGGTPGAGGPPVAAGGGAEGGAIPVEAGADGKALIEVDGLAITAEVDPLTGEINLTVDNGDGTPEEYGVEFGEDQADDGGAGIPTVDGAVPLPAEADAGQPDVRAMPFETGETLIGQESGVGTAVGGVGEPLTAQESGFGVGGGAEPLIGQPEPAMALGDPAGAAPDPGFGQGGFTAPSTEPSGFTAPVADAGGFAPGQGGFTTMPAADAGGFAPGQGGFAPGQGGFTTMPAADAGGFAPGQGGFQPGQGGFAPGSGGFTTMPAADAGGFAPGGGGGAGGPQFAQHDQAFSAPVAGDTSGTTTTSGASVLGNSGPGGFGGADSVWGAPASDGTWSSPSGSADQGLASDTSTSQAGQPGSASLPSMSDAHGQASGSAMGGGMMGGMPMGGGMAGGGQQGGGDTERSPGQWRTTGSLFDDDVSLSRVQGVLGEEGR